MRITRSAWVAVATMALAGVALGQQQVHLGNALDANPQVGSGGSNRPVPGYVPINGNDIITGNVAGLKYFHGQAGTVSPYVFQAPLGSSTLENFARQSAGGVPTGTGTSLNQAYFLPSSTVSTAQGALYSAPRAGGFDSRLVPTSAASPASDNSRLVSPVAAGLPIRSYDRQAALQASINEAGATAAAEANPLGVSASQTPIVSPLFGLRQATNAAAAELQAQENEKTTPPPEGTEKSGALLNPREIENNPGEQNGEGTNGTLKPRRSANARIETGVGENANNPNGTNEPLDLRVTGTYRTLLQDLQKARGGTNQPGNLAEQTGPNRRNGTGTASDLAVGANQRTHRNPSEVANGTSAGQNLATGPGAGSPNANTSAYMATGGGGNALPYQAINPAGAAPPPSSLGLQGVNGAMLENESTSVLQAGQKVEPLKSLATTPSGVKPQPFDELMTRAEELLKQEKYLEAADAYQVALTSEPNNALAILGRGNAELAAGMYESAAWDLQFVFTRKPELISVRYMLGDYLPAKRQAYLLDDLKKLATVKDTGNMASFLYCYLCYDLGRQNDMRDELQRWDNRPWKDAWQQVLSRAWIKADAK